MISAFAPDPCCHRPSIANMDHVKRGGVEAMPMVNRICLNCYSHWYGNDGVAVVQFTRKSWDNWMSQPSQ